MVPESYLSLWEEICLSKVPGISLVDNYLNLEPGILNLEHTALRKAFCWEQRHIIACSCKRQSKCSAPSMNAYDKVPLVELSLLKTVEMAPFLKCRLILWSLWPTPTTSLQTILCSSEQTNSTPPLYQFHVSCLSSFNYGLRDHKMPRLRNKPWNMKPNLWHYQPKEIFLLCMLFSEVQWL